MTTKQPWWVSSKGEGLSRTLQGLVATVAPLLLLVARSQGIDVADGELQELAGAVGLLITSAWAVFGIVARLVHKVRKTGKYAV